MNYSPEISQLDIPHTLVIFLASITGLVHFYLAPQIGLNTLGISFLVAGIGFMALIGSVILDYRRTTAYILGVIFTAGQIVIWYHLNRPQLELIIRGEPLLDVVDKLSQVLLIILLVYLYLAQRE